MRRTTALLLLLAAALATARVARAASATEGQQAYDAGRFIEALRDWMPLAEAGDRDAAFGLGLLYDLGSGVAPDPGAALRWYQRAADAGLPAAEFNVAVLYDSGHGVPRNAGLAAQWYARAAAHGHLRAQYDLGQLYQDGDGVPSNLGLAAAWFAHAAPNLAAAATRLNELKPMLAVRRVPAQQSVQPPTPELLAPEDGARLGGELPSGVRRSEVELVWSAQEVPEPARFFVELRGVEGDAAGARSGAPEIFQSYVDVSSVLVTLPRRGAQYAWRVFEVTDSPPRYAVSAWHYFSVGDPAGSVGMTRLESERLDDHHDDDH